MRSGYARFAVSAIFCLSVARLFHTGTAQETEVAATGDASRTTGGFVSVLTDTGLSAVDTARETGKSVEEVVRAGGRTTLALGNFVGNLFNTLSAAVATGSGYLASGIGSVDGYANSWPVLGVLTGGANNLVSGFASAYNDMSTNGRETRQKMFAKFREQLDQSASGASAAEVQVVTDGAK